MTIVVDANVTLALATRRATRRGREELIAPPLMWSEARSAIHVARWRGIVDDLAVERVLAFLESGRIGERNPKELGRRAIRLADTLGWAKTYDAEYLALAQARGSSLATLDRRLKRAAEIVGIDVRMPGSR